MQVTNMILLFIFALINLRTAQSFGIFINQGNIEKMYLMEEEIMSMTDAFLRREFFKHHGEDPHNLTHIVKFAERCKDIHRKAQDMFLYLKHPVNVFHLVLRLHEDWPAALESILESEPCQLWNLGDLNKRIDNMRNNIPSKSDMFSTASSLVIIKETTGTSMEEFSKGIINNHTSVEPLSLSHLVLLGRGAYEEGNYKPARDILAYVNTSCLKGQRSVNSSACNSVKNLALMAQAYAKMGQFEEAIKTLDAVLEIDPNHKLAKLNRKYYLSQIKKDKGRRYFENNWRVKYTSICSGQRKKTPQQMSRLHCRMFPTENRFVFAKAEWVHNKPPIVVFHHLVPLANVNALKTSGWAKTQYVAHDDLYKTPEFTATIHGTRSSKVFTRAITSLTGAIIPPYIPGYVEVRNFGLQGLYFTRDVVKQVFKYNVASYFLELPSEFEGGEYVFPRYRVKTQLTPGSVLFLYASKSIVHICPVTYGTKWLALQSIEEQETNFCRIYDKF